ncbi:hypothetical protein A3A56_03460 [Candidatus Roizmanbacteria bacterium RIFCSPLOWO2_01_FULL_40_32]|nr:MAG: hypothetical protein A3A56_03460 [Candidatus Roizmanbacteria bacterium RIFCSPLOWO2_01_FULL_40_32]
MKKNIFIYIDESGTLPDPKSLIVIIAAVGTGFPQELSLAKKTAAKTSIKNNSGEIKFYRSGDNTKRKFLQILAKQDVSIFVLVVEKHGQIIADSPENFAFVCSLILNDCLNYYQHETLSMVFDRHFHRLADQEKFNTSLELLLGKKLTIIHVDSLNESTVNTADMVAGSVLWSRTGKNPAFYEIIKSKVVEEKIINWKEAKGKFWHKKTRPNRRTRPSESE